MVIRIAYGHTVHSDDDWLLELTKRGKDVLNGLPAGETLIDYIPFGKLPICLKICDVLTDRND